MGTLNQVRNNARGGQSQMVLAGKITPDAESATRDVMATAGLLYFARSE
jgi:hypothetical protein